MRTLRTLGLAAVATGIVLSATGIAAAAEPTPGPTTASAALSTALGELITSGSASTTPTTPKPGAVADAPSTASADLFTGSASYPAE